MAHTIVNTDGDRWRFLRNTLLSTFSPAKMRMVSVTSSGITINYKLCPTLSSGKSLKNKLIWFIAKVILLKRTKIDSQFALVSLGYQYPSFVSNASVCSHSSLSLSLFKASAFYGVSKDDKTFTELRFND